MKFFLTIAFAFIIYAFECQKPYNVVTEVIKIYQTYDLINGVVTDLTKKLNPNPISYPRTDISRLILSPVGIPMPKLPEFKIPTFKIPTTDNPIKPVVKITTEDLGKYLKVLAEIDMEINNQQKMNDEEFFILPSKNSYSTNSNKFKPHSYQPLILTKDENGFFKFRQ
jgi:hypothetical protein